MDDGTVTASTLRSNPFWTEPESSKAPDPTDVTDDLISTVASFGHPENALEPIDPTPSDITTVVISPRYGAHGVSEEST